MVYLLGGIHEGFVVACANEANVYVLQRNIFVAEVLFGKFERTCFEVTDVLIFLEILYHLPDDGAFCHSGRYKFLSLSYTRPSFRCLFSGT